jgi:FkbM family methyltransferase
MIDTIKYSVLSNRGYRSHAYVTIHPKSSHFPVLLRPATSDIQVFHQIFIEEEYAPLKNLKNIDYIIDCGANIGLSSAYLLSQFPKASLIAIEPAKTNLSMLEKNLAPYGDRAEIICGAIWPESVPLEINKHPYRDGQEWSFTVTPKTSEDNQTIRGIAIKDILEPLDPCAKILMKIDIEGTETLLFQSDLSWLKTIHAIAIELHEDSPFGPCKDLFNKAIDKTEFELTTSGELILGTKPSFSSVR